MLAEARQKFWERPADLIRIRECATGAEFFGCPLFRVSDADVWRWKALKQAQLEDDTERAKR